MRKSLKKDITLTFPTIFIIKASQGLCDSIVAGNRTEFEKKIVYEYNWA